jgi:Coenzyme PQQ synthesis protein D (PqqD)
MPGRNQKSKPMLSASAIPRKAERIAARVVDGEALVMVIDRRELHRLSAVGTRVFELCDGASTVDAIVAAIVREFEVEPDVARSDIEQFLTQLSAAGALALADGA